MCQSLLFTGEADQVLVGTDPGALDPLTRLVALRIERRPTCPAVRLSRVFIPDAEETAPGNGILLANASSGGVIGSPSMDERSAALIAAGYCLTGRPARLADADLILHSRQIGLSGQPDVLSALIGMSGTELFVEGKIGPRQFTNVARYREGTYNSLTVPLAIYLPSREVHWVSSVRRWENGPERSAEPPFGTDTALRRYVRLRLAVPPYIGRAQVRTLLDQGLAAAREGRRDARLGLARQYFDSFGPPPRLSPNEADLELIPRLIAEPAVMLDDLRSSGSTPPSTVGRIPSVAGPMIERVLSHSSTEERWIGRAAWMVASRPQTDRARAIPLLRRLARDPSRRGSAYAAFIAFQSGDQRDVALFTSLFRKNWPPLSFAQIQPPITAGMRADQDRRSGNILVALKGLCALGPKARQVTPLLVDSARTTEFSVQQVEVKQLWATLQHLGVDIRGLAALAPLDRDARSWLNERATLGVSVGEGCTV